MTDKPDDVAALLSDLRCLGSHSTPSWHDTVKNRAADLIERLAAENAKLKGDALTSNQVHAFIKAWPRIASLMNDNPYYATECAQAIWNAIRDADRIIVPTGAAIDAAIGRDSAERDALLVQPVPDKH